MSAQVDQARDASTVIVGPKLKADAVLGQPTSHAVRETRDNRIKFPERQSNQ